MGTTGEALKAKEDDDEAADSRHITLPANEKEDKGTDTAQDPAAIPPTPALPSLGTQAKHLIQRRWSTLWRSQWEWIAHLSFLLLAPVIMAFLILPNEHFLTAVSTGDTSAAALWPAAYTCAMGWLLQILMVMGFSVRTGAREIARERGLYQRELAGGLRPLAYLLGKLGYLLPMVAAQSFLLGSVVELLSGMPGFVLPRLILLCLTGIAFTSLCLATSAYSPTAERAHSRAWMLLFTNLLLCGALLGFPRVLGGVLQPLVTAYYGWSGGIETLKDTALFEPLTHFVRTWFATPLLAVIALTVHTLIGVLLTLRGLRKGRIQG